MNTRISLLSLFVILLAAGTVFRIRQYVSAPPEYDEIYTEKTYVRLPVSVILDELETPNNHPLFSVCCSPFAGPEEDSVRLSPVRIPALAAGLLLLIGGSLLVLRLFRSLPAACLFAAFLSASDLLCYYSGIARGYSLQTLFFFLFLLALFGVRGTRSPRTDRMTAVAVFLSGLGTCLTVTSGALFCAAAGVVYLLFRVADRDIRRSLIRHARTLAAGCLAGAIVLVWLLRHYDQLQAARQFGAPIRSVKDFLTFAYTTGSGLGILWFFLVSAAGCLVFRAFRLRRIVLAMLSIAGLVLLSAVFSKAGPVRAYIPLIPAAALAAALTVDGVLRRFRKKLPCAVLFCAVPACCLIPFLKQSWPPGAECRATDWPAIAESLNGAPELAKIYPLFPVPDTIVLRFCAGKTPYIQTQKLEFPLEGLLAVDVPPGKISVSDPRGAAVSLLETGVPPVRTIPLRNGMTAHLYGLRKPEPSDDERGAGLLVMQYFKPDSRIPGIPLLPDMNCLTPNLFFRSVEFRRGEQTYSGGLIFLTDAVFSCEQIRAMEKMSNGMFRFYRLTGGADAE